MVAQDLVEGWLDDAPGLKYVSHELDEDSPYAWAIEVGGQDFPTLVAQRDVEFNHLFIQVTIPVSDIHQESLGSAPEDDRDRFLFDLKIALSQAPVGYNILVDENDSLPLLVVLGYNLLEDPVQRSGFFRRNHQLQKTARLAATMFQKFHRFREWG